MKTISKHDFISMVLEYFGLTERSRKHVTEIYNANGFFQCKSGRDARVQNFINGNVGDYNVI